MPIATNPKTGEVVFLGDDGQWQPAQRAVNPDTHEMLAFDGREWKPVPASKGVFNYIDDAVRAVASGVTFGFADELAAKADELTGRGGTYEQNVARERARDAQIPTAIKIPGEVAGAVGSTVVGAPIAAGAAAAALPARVAQTLRGLPELLKYLGLGTVEGAAAGAGGATEGERLSGAATGAAVGGAVGAAAPSVVRGVTSAVRNVAGAVRPSSGAAADIGRAIVRDEDTPAALLARQAAAEAERPGVATVADVGGENVKGLVERVAQTPGAGRTQVVPALTERQQQQLARVTNDLQTLTGSRRSAFQATEEVAAERAASAAPLYTQAYEAGDRALWSPGLERLSGSPTVRDAMAGAVRVWQDNVIADGYGAMNPGVLVEGGGNLTFLNGRVPVFPNLQFWDYTKRIVDDQVGTAIRNGQDQKARTLTRLSNVLRSEIDQLAPEYRAARDAWAGPSAFLNAIEEGRTILSKNISAEEMAAGLRALNASEREGYRIGAISSIISKMGNDPAKLADMTKYLRSPEVRAKVAAIMPTEDAAASWNRRLGFEIASSELTGRALGNSATARRLAEQNDAKGIVGDLVMDALTTGPSTIGVLRRVFTAGPRWLRDTIRSRTDKEIADILLNPDRAAELPSIIQRAQTARRATGTRGAASTTAGSIAVAE